MSDTNFIKQIDKMLKKHYGEDFHWKSIFVSNFSSKKGTGYVSIDREDDSVEGFVEMLDAKMKAKALKKTKGKEEYNNG